MDLARKAAVQAFVKQSCGGYANLVLNNVLQKQPLSAQDKAIASALFYGAVEHQITLKAILSRFVARPLAQTDATLQAILCLGLYQARYMHTKPVPMCVSEWVAFTKDAGKAKAAGMVNAVLRKAAAFDMAEFSFADNIERCSVLYSASPTVVRCLQKSYPQEYENILQASFLPPRLCVRVNTLKTTQAQLKESFAAADIACEDTPLANALYVTVKGDITQLPAFQEGLFHVQSLASQLACAALAPQKGSRVLDACAAPGGKSATLAQYMENAGQLYSCDAAKNRLSLIDAVFARNGVTCAETLQQDASVYNPQFENMDAVLCDVPCSGLGVLAKKPDIRYKELNELPQLVALQKNILATAARYVKPGGVLVYSTCTLNRDENERVVEAFLANAPQFRLCEVAAAPAYARTQNKMITFVPDEQHNDGFFVAKLERL